MAAKNRVSKNSIAGAVEIATALQKVLLSPIPLTDEEQIIFDEVIHSREAATWSKYDLRVAANLAQFTRKLHELQEILNMEGYTVRNERGTMVGNPHGSILMQMSSVVGTISKQLGLSASQKGISGQDQAKRNTADRQAREAIEKAGSDELI